MLLIYNKIKNFIIEVLKKYFSNDKSNKIKYKKEIIIIIIRKKLP